MKGHNHFLQSQEWEEFQRSLGREVFRVGKVLFVKLPLILRRSYFYIGGVPNFQFSIFNFQSIFNSSNFQTLVKQHNAAFLKFEPMAENKIPPEELIRMGFKKSRKEVQPQKTIILDLAQSEEELLRKMHSKTRYNIRVGERSELRIMNYESGIDDDIFEEFWELIQKTAKRDAFYTHTKEYYRKLLDSYFMIHNSKTSQTLRICLFTAWHQDRIIAANIILFHGDTAYYLHGASDYEYRKLMAPYLLHWEVIKYARERGFSDYDLWGIDEKKWPGVTRFKKGFGGNEVEYIGSYDYVFEPMWYKLYKVKYLVSSI